MRKFMALLVVVLLLVPAWAAAQQMPAKSGNATFDRAVAIVLDRFYTADRLDRFKEAVELTLSNLPRLQNAEPDVVDDAIDYVLASLETSHTGRFTADELDYYELLDVFRFAVRDDVRRLFRRGRVIYPGVGMATAEIGGAIFVTDVYDGGPADRAGVLVGDQILSVDGEPFSEIDAFGAKVGETAALTVRRRDDLAPMTIDVAVEWLRPSESLLAAIENSARIVDHDGFKVGVLRLWSYTERETKGVVAQALTGPLAEADGLVLDLRSRWGGAPADTADTFVGGAPDMVMTGRDGEADVVNARWRKPVVAIIDEGTRSGMEVLAYGLKTNGVPMIGTGTAGDVVAGTAFILPDDSLLEVAVADVTVDGTRLEGVGIAPDIVVPFDIRYAAGRDPQMDAAVAEMARILAD